MTENRAREQALTKALEQFRKAHEYGELLRAVVKYNMTDHVGMVRGDGEMMRFISYLARQQQGSVDAGMAQLMRADIAEPLPF